jgi:hypothetical protein
MAILFASLAAASEALSGCVTPAYYEYDAAFDVHRISERSLSGAESIVTIVSPIVSSDSAKAYPDSLRYIIVNGDTAYRHSVSALTPVFDSAAPYHTDGTINYVALVYDSLTIRDTTYETGFSAAITAPPYGDTIQTANDAIFSFQSIAGSANPLSCFMEISDSSSFYSNDIVLGAIGTVDFPASSLKTLQPGILWADLRVAESATDYFITNIQYYEIIVEHQVDLDRIVAYHLR